MIRIYIDCVGANRPLLSGLLSLQLEQACAPGRVRASAAFCKALLPPDAWLGFGLEEGVTATALSPQPQAASLGLRDADSEVAWWPSVESESGDSEGSAAAGNDPGRSNLERISGARSSWTGPERTRPGRQASYVSTSLLKLKRSAFAGRDSLEAPPVASASDGARSYSENGSVGSFVARPADPVRPSANISERGSGGGVGGGGAGRNRISRSLSADFVGASLTASGPHHASFDGSLPPHPRSSFMEAAPLTPRRAATPAVPVSDRVSPPKFAIDAAGPMTLAGVGPSDTFYIELRP